jgi:type II secretory pathway pseudopilin PulG
MIASGQKRPGLTLAELVIVLLVLVAVAGIIVPRMTAATANAKQQTTIATMERLREVIAGTPQLPGYWNDILSSSADPNQTPLTMRDLFYFNVNLLAQYPQFPSLQTFDPTIRHGWHGPYLVNASGYYPDPTNPVAISHGFTATYGAIGDPAMLDGWGNPIVIQWPQVSGATATQVAPFVRLVSAGANGILETPLGITDLSQNNWLNAGDDIVLYLRQPLSFVPRTP